MFIEIRILERSAPLSEISFLVKKQPSFSKVAFAGAPAGIRTPTSGSGGLRDIPFTTGASIAALGIISFQTFQVNFPRPEQVS
jgi:hypothetical protein